MSINDSPADSARMGNLMTFFKDLYGFLKVRKKFWLAPMLLVLLLFGALVVLGEGSALAPFIYTVF